MRNVNRRQGQERGTSTQDVSGITSGLSYLINMDTAARNKSRMENKRSKCEVMPAKIQRESALSESPNLTISSLKNYKPDKYGIRQPLNLPESDGFKRKFLDSSNHQTQDESMRQSRNEFRRTFASEMHKKDNEDGDIFSKSNFFSKYSKSIKNQKYVTFPPENELRLPHAAVTTSNITTSETGVYSNLQVASKSGMKLNEYKMPSPPSVINSSSRKTSKERTFRQTESQKYVDPAERLTESGSTPNDEGALKRSMFLASGKKNSSGRAGTPSFRPQNERVKPSTAAFQKKADIPKRQNKDTPVNGQRDGEEDADKILEKLKAGSYNQPWLNPIQEEADPVTTKRMGILRMKSKTKSVNAGSSQYESFAGAVEDVSKQISMYKYLCITSKRITVEMDLEKLFNEFADENMNNERLQSMFEDVVVGFLRVMLHTINFTVKNTLERQLLNRKMFEFALDMLGRRYDWC